MIAEWLVTGVSWAVKVSSMVITLMLVAGVVLGILKLIFGRGNNDEDKNPKNNDDETGIV